MAETYNSIVEEFKRRLISRDVEAVIFLLTEYREVIARLAKDLDELNRVIEVLKRQGAFVSEFDLLRQIRYREFISQIRREMQAYADLVVDVVNAAQIDVINLAFEQTDALFRFKYEGLPSDIYESFTRFDEFSARNIIARYTDKNYLAGITRQFEQVSLNAVRNLLVDGVIRGRSTKDIKIDLIKQFNVVPQIAETIARTEVISAYRDGNLDRYRSSPVVKAWEWSATLDERTCPVCIFLDGQIFPLDVPFASHPNCRCSPLPVTFTFEELGLGNLNLVEPKDNVQKLRGEDWFRSQPDSVQRKILGKGKHELYESGQITLGDLEERYTHPLYGPSRQERSIKSLKELRIL